MKVCGEFCRILCRLYSSKDSKLLVVPRITQVIAARQKGHSKWQNIRHTKAANDAIRQRLFSKLAYKIGVAIRANSMQTDPRLNRDLERLLQECGEKNMPKATIQRAIDRAVSKPIHTVYYDVKGPGGSLFIVEALTENKEQTRNQLKKHFNKIGGFVFADQGIRMFFEEKGVISVVQSPVNVERGSKKSANPVPQYSLSLEEAVNVAIDVGAEEVEESVEEDDQQIIKVHRVCKELTSRGYVIKSSENEYLSVNPIKLDDQHKQQVDLFFETMHSMENVNRVFDNTE